MEQWRDDAEHAEAGGPHAVGFANLDQGDVYGECLCGWSTTLRNPDVDRLPELVAEARSRVSRHP